MSGGTQTAFLLSNSGVSGVTFLERESNSNNNRRRTVSCHLDTVINWYKNSFRSRPFLEVSMNRYSFFFFLSP